MPYFFRFSLILFCSTLLTGCYGAMVAVNVIGSSAIEAGQAYEKKRSDQLARQSEAERIAEGKTRTGCRVNGEYNYATLKECSAKGGIPTMKYVADCRYASGKREYSKPLDCLHNGGNIWYALAPDTPIELKRSEREFVDSEEATYKKNTFSDLIKCQLDSYGSYIEATQQDCDDLKGL